MRKLALIFLIALGIIIQSKAAPKIGGNGVVLGLIGGIGITIAYEHFWYDGFDGKNGLYISPGIDPKMLSEYKLDLRQKIFYKHNRYNPYLVVETFGWAEYESFTGGLDYTLIDRRLALLTGFETGVIHNQGGYAWTYGGNIELRLYTKKKYSISYIGNVKNRPLISKNIVYSGYIHLNIKL
jgi:hypothetical protein